MLNWNPQVDGGQYGLIAPWYFFNMLWAFIGYNNQRTDGIFVYTTEDERHTWANMVACDGNKAVRIKWREHKYADVPKTLRVENRYNAFSMRFEKDMLNTVKNQYMELIAVDDECAQWRSLEDRRKLTVQLMPEQDTIFEDKYVSGVFKLYECAFFSPTKEDWESRKLPMSMPILPSGLLPALDIKKFGFSKDWDKKFVSELKPYCPRLFGLRKQGMDLSLERQTDEGLHGVDFPEIPDSFRWYRDVQIEIVFMPMQTVQYTGC